MEKKKETTILLGCSMLLLITVTMFSGCIDDEDPPMDGFTGTLYYVDAPCDIDGECWAIIANGGDFYLDDGFLVSANPSIYEFTEGEQHTFDSGEIVTIDLQERYPEQQYLTGTYTAFYLGEPNVVGCNPNYDVNDNGVVNFQDAGLTWIHRTMPMCDPPNEYDSTYDMDCDLDVDIVDYITVWQNRD